MTITISSNEPLTIDRILQGLQSLRREKLVFDIKTDDDVKNAAIRERLRLKHILNNDWSKMDDDERQATLSPNGVSKFM